MKKVLGDFLDDGEIVNSNNALSEECTGEFVNEESKETSEKNTKVKNQSDNSEDFSSRQKSYVNSIENCFKHFENPDVLSAAEALEVIQRQTGEVDIPSSMSKSSNAIHDLIDFKSINIPDFHNVRRNSRVPMDPLIYQKFEMQSKQVDPSKTESKFSTFLEPLDYDEIRSQLILQNNERNKIEEVEAPDVSQILNIPLEESEESPVVIKEATTDILDLFINSNWGLVEQLLRDYDRETPFNHIEDSETGETPLMFACKENRLVIVDRLLSMNIDVNKVTKDNRTALYIAAQYSKDEIIKLLLSKKADSNIFGGERRNLPLHIACSRTVPSPAIVNSLLKATKNCRLQVDNNGAIPLIYAIEAGATTVVKELLEKEAIAQINSKIKLMGDTAIHIACRKNEIEILRLLCDAEVPINIQNGFGQTGLHIAAEEGNENIVKYLHSMKANANILDSKDRSALHMAAEKGHTNVVEYLIDKFKCNVMTRDVEGNTLMHITSLSGHPQTTMALLKRGVPLHMPNKEGSLCLHVAAQRGHVDVVQTLLDKGANVNARAKDLYTPLHTAVKHGNPSVVEALLGYGAEVNVKGGLLEESPLQIAAQLKGGERCADMLLKSGANVNEKMKNGETALHIAARTGNVGMLKAMLNEGAIPSIISLDGNNPLHIAVRYCHYPIVNELITFINRTMSRANAVILVNMPNKEGVTPLHLAAELEKKRVHSDFEDVDTMKLLLEYDGDMSIQTKFTQETPLHYCSAAGNSDILHEIINHLDHRMMQAVNRQAKNGWSPLLFASNNGHQNIVNILIKCHARVDVFDEHGMTALHLACEKGHVEVAEELLKQKAFVNAKSKGGLTPLHLAAQNGFKELLEILINKYKASIDAVTLNRKTPLHLAAQCGQRDVCHALLFDKRNPADPNAIDSKHQTPMHLAAKNDHSHVVKLFLKFKPELLTLANLDGMTCAHIAAANGSLTVIKEFMKFNKIIINGVKNKTTGSTPLHLAAEGGHYEVVKALVDAGASAAEENNDGMTCLHIAAKYGHIELLKCLKNKIHQRVVSNKTGMTPLHVAAHYGQLDFLREMLADVPANVRSERPKTGEQIKDLLTESGLTPLHLAAQSGHENIVRLLLNCSGVEVDSKTLNNKSIPLHFAAENGHTNVTSLLLSKSALQISKRDSKGRTPLHLASSRGHLEMVSLLIGQGAQINATDNLNFTALHFASRSGYLKVCEILVDSGAICDKETNDFKIPITFAAFFNHTDVLSFLLHQAHSTENLMEDSKFLYNLMVCSKLNNSKSLEEFVLLSPAPAETAAKLSEKFSSLSESEKERSKDLLIAAEYCEEMCTDLVSLAAADVGADKLLRAIDNNGAPFLDILIETEQKHVISHPSVQKYLSDLWMGSVNWPMWQLFLLLLVFALVPITWLLALLPFQKRIFSSPMIKFFIYLISHIYVTIILMYVAVFDQYPSIRTSWIPTLQEWLLLICLSGHLVSELINPNRKGIGKLNILTLVLTICATMIQIFASFVVVPQLSELIFVRNVLSSIAILMCMIVLIDFLAIHHTFGPWTIILMETMKDLFLFLVIMFLFLTGFACVIAATYLPTQTLIATDYVPKIYYIFSILYFSLFGLVSPTDLPSPNTSPSYAQTLNTIEVGISLGMDFIVLINLLVAMMSDTYQRIYEQSDIEWKFGRAKMIRNMKMTTSVASPFIFIAQLFYYCDVIYCKLRNLPAPKSYDDDFDQSIFESSVTNSLRRKSQVAPESFDLKKPQETIEDVVDWSVIVKRYLAIRSVEGGQITTED